jgi:hypothetical protein
MSTRILQRSVAALLVSSLALFHITAICAADPATQPAAETSTELTARQRNLLLQLSNAEANIQAINKALRVTGYKVGIAYDRIESNRKGNEIMDRNGGGPVRWDDFYGRTARDFYAPQSWGTLHAQGNGASVDIQIAENNRPLKRPAQFDYIYAANNDQIDRANEQIASFQHDQAALLARRAAHESDQTRLWALLSWERVKDQEIALRPLYRFALKPQGADAGVLRPIIRFLRATDIITSGGLQSLKVDQPSDAQAAAFAQVSEQMQDAYAALQVGLADAVLAPALKAAHSDQADALKSLCKNLSEESEVIADNCRMAIESDRANEDTSKLEFRAELQSSLAYVAAAGAELDEQIRKTAEDWNLTADNGVANPDAAALGALIDSSKRAQSGEVLPPSPDAGSEQRGAAPDSPKPQGGSADATATDAATSDNAVYLCDLSPLSVRTFSDGTWSFGNKGELGNGQDKIVVDGVNSPHGLGTHPPSSGAAVIRYELDRKYSKLTGYAAIDDTSQHSNSPLIFRINGDGHEIWRARPVQAWRDARHFSIDLTGVKMLELIVDCPGDHDGAHAVWVEPTLFRAAHLFDVPDDADTTADSKPKNTPEPSEKAGSGNARGLVSNAGDVQEADAIAAEVIARYPEVLKSVRHFELVKCYDASEMRRSGGGPRDIDGAFSAQPVAGRTGGPMFWGIYQKLDPGSYIIVYRVQALSLVSGKKVCFLDVCRGGNTIASRRPNASEFTAGKWIAVPIPLKLDSQGTVEYRLWPDGHEIGLDRIYVFHVPDDDATP